MYTNNKILGLTFSLLTCTLQAAELDEIDDYYPETHEPSTCTIEINPTTINVLVNITFISAYHAIIISLDEADDGNTLITYDVSDNAVQSATSDTIYTHNDLADLLNDDVDEFEHLEQAPHHWNRWTACKEALKTMYAHLRACASACIQSITALC